MNKRSKRFLIETFQFPHYLNSFSFNLYTYSFWKIGNVFVNREFRIRPESRSHVKAILRVSGFVTSKTEKSCLTSPRRPEDQLSLADIFTVYPTGIRINDLLDVIFTILIVTTILRPSLLSEFVLMKPLASYSLRNHILNRRCGGFKASAGQSLEIKVS
ncbi:MAG: hypothetical protein HKM05_06745 [Spirochaetales bacterium]|nr:hypothetical protein [Spirochaetales bacterium]